MKPKLTKEIIGRKEIIDLPSLKIFGVDAKIDTGAYGCAIHCNCIEEKKKAGEKYVSFVLLDPSHPQYNGKKYKVKNYVIKKIKNSFGQVEKRYVIKSNILIFGVPYKTELSLTDRSEMKFPILIGRTFLRGRFIVDVSKYNLSKKNSERKRKEG